MRGCPEIIGPGSVFLLDDLTYAQVTAVAGGRVRLRLRDGAPCLRRLRALHGMPAVAFRPLVLAEVDAAFFPEFAAAGGGARPRSPGEAARLHAALRDVTGRRPFGPPGTSDQP